jgi:hypothetical protein
MIVLYAGVPGKGKVIKLSHDSFKSPESLADALYRAVSFSFVARCK